MWPSRSSGEENAWGVETDQQNYTCRLDGVALCVDGCIHAQDRADLDLQSSCMLTIKLRGINVAVQQKRLV